MARGQWRPPGRTRPSRTGRTDRRHPGGRPAHRGANCAASTDPHQRLSDLERELYRTGPYGQAFYSITRDGIPLDTPVKVIPEPVDRSLALGLRVIGLIYLAIGIYVLFRRWTAPRATHFYLFCLVSFALYALKYTSQLDVLDWTVFWVNIVAESLQPALFLHFALSFPEERFKSAPSPLAVAALYAPAPASSACGSGPSHAGRRPVC